MTALGINIARDGSQSAEEIHRLGAKWVRVVLMPENNPAVLEQFQALQKLGIKIMGVIARESFSVDDDWQDPVLRLAFLQMYRELYGPYLTAVQVGNEPDTESPSSWTMGQGTLYDLTATAREAFPDHIRVLGGMASGQSTWLETFDFANVHAIAIHPYLKDAPNPDDQEDLPDVTEIVAQYREYGLPLYITEWGWWGDTKRGADEVDDMLGWAAKTTEVQAFIYFCLSDSMVPPFGLYDKRGRDKYAYIFQDRAKYAVETPAEPKPPVLVQRNPWEYWSADTISSLVNVPLQAVNLIWPRLHEQLTNAGIVDLYTQVAMIATVAIETAHRFWPIHEFPDWRKYPETGGYPPHYDGGPNYHGRGLIQNTHLYNYRILREWIVELWNAGMDDPRFDFVANPDLLLDPDMSAAAAACYFRHHGGYGLNLIPNAARQQDWARVRKLVQGADAGLELFTEYANSLLRHSSALAQPVEPTAQEQIDGLTTAVNVLVNDIIPKIILNNTDNRALQEEALRIRKQFTGV